MKTYTEKGNASRAAKVAYGRAAKNGVDFKITGTAGAWRYEKMSADESAAAKQPGRKKARKGTRSPLWQQPQAIKALKLALRTDGVSVKQGASALGTEEHTFRGFISRLRGELPGLTAGRAFKVVHYKLSLENAPEGLRDALK